MTQLASLKGDASTMKLLRNRQRPEATVVHYHQGQPIERKGRGFSKAELNEARITLGDAKHLGLPVDSNRTTSYPSNVNSLKESQRRTHTGVGPG